MILLEQVLSVVLFGERVGYVAALETLNQMEKLKTWKNSPD